MQKYQRTLGICIEMVLNIILRLMTLTFILLNILIYLLILVISTCVLLFLVFTNSHISHLFLSLDLRNNLSLLTKFARLTCLVHYIGC